MRGARSLHRAHSGGLGRTAVHDLLPTSRDEDRESPPDEEAPARSRTALPSASPDTAPDEYTSGLAASHPSLEALRHVH